MLEIMMNLKTQSQKSEVKLSEIGNMLKLISMEYPQHSNDAKMLAILIEEEFDVICTEADVKGYHELHIIHEDFELESKKQEFGIIY